MKKLYVAGKNPKSNDWIPVAKLEKLDDGGYSLSYTKGASRLNGFSGLGRMNRLEEKYFSKELFPFFSNRLISKSRPEYKQYLQWLALNELNDDPMNIMGITGGLRVTDSFELIPCPDVVESKLTLKFFPKRLRYLPSEVVKLVDSITENHELIIFKDIQNEFDDKALGLRLEKPTIIIGYIARYYSAWLSRLIEEKYNIELKVLNVNHDAPIDMRVLCGLSIFSINNELPLIDQEDDFKPFV